MNNYFLLAISAIIFSVYSVVNFRSLVNIHTKGLLQSKYEYEQDENNDWSFEKHIGVLWFVAINSTIGAVLCIYFFVILWVQPEIA